MVFTFPKRVPECESCCWMEREAAVPDDLLHIFEVDTVGDSLRHHEGQMGVVQWKPGAVIEEEDQVVGDFFFFRVKRQLRFFVFVLHLVVSL